MDQKKGRGRPRKTNDQKELDKELTKQLFVEIRENSGLIIEKLYEEINESNFPGIRSDSSEIRSDYVWRKYSCGKLAMGDDRARNLAAWAWSKGWRGPHVKATLLKHRVTTEQQSQNNKSDNVEKALKKIEILFEGVLSYLLKVRMSEDEVIDSSNNDLTNEEIDHFNLLIKAASTSAISSLRTKIQHDNDYMDSDEYFNYAESVIDERMANSIQVPVPNSDVLRAITELPEFLKNTNTKND